MVNFLPSPLPLLWGVSKDLALQQANLWSEVMGYHAQGHNCITTHGWGIGWGEATEESGRLHGGWVRGGIGVL